MTATCMPTGGTRIDVSGERHLRISCGDGQSLRRFQRVVRSCDALRATQSGRSTASGSAKYQSTMAFRSSSLSSLSPRGMR